MLEELKRALNAHDWYHEMADDHNIYTAGRDSKHRMLNLVSKAIETQGAAARKVVEDFYKMRLANASAQFNPYSILKHYI